MLTIISAIVLAQAATSQAPPAAPPPGCTGEEYNSFDFWIGEWDVYPTGKERLVAHSRVEKLYGGCAVRENWMPLGGTGGGSLNGYDPQSGHWRQFWIGSSPGVVEFVGGPANGGMVLTGYWAGFAPDGSEAMVRQTFTPVDKNNVRQHGEASFDHGLTWSTRYDFTYRRRTEKLE